MKKVVLIIVICFLIPCFSYAQEPDWFLGIESTLWVSRVIAGDEYLGFYQGDICACSCETEECKTLECSKQENSFYIDLFGVSFFTYGYDYANGVLFSPLGIGIIWITLISPFFKIPFLMIKVDDSWNPPE